MKIYVPVDQSRRDGIVLPHCTRLAQALHSTITVVHVVPFTRSIIPGAVREAEAYVSNVEEGLREAGRAVESIVRRGDPADVIVELASELGANIVVMASRS